MRKFASLLTMLMFFAALAFGQNRTITGTVTDESGAIVPGASVSIKGQRTGTATDQNGKFTIQAKTGDVLIITGVGIDPVQVTV
ncbi:MAG TPA: carboxypeptidase-like regulatory domain-containing protein, partial [Chitinophagaceae bacterium]|nr:carboxypeptidase-like regulatory domain-containing protein [Chitinophagaceae bacterium]